MLLYVCATFCLLGLAAGGSVIQSNQYLDSVLINSLPQDIQRNRQDPAKLHDFTQHTKDKVTLITVNVKADYKNGNLTGLSRPVREKNCTTTSFLRGQFCLNCTVGLGSLAAHYKGVLEYGKLPKINFKVEAPITKVLVYTQFCSTSNGRNPQVTDFRLTTGVFFNAKYEGLGVASSVEKNLKANFTYTATNDIVNVINSQFRSSLQRSVVNTILPL